MLLWGTTGQLVHDLTLTLAQAGYVPRVLESDAQLATEHLPGVLLLAEYGQRLETQQAFLRGPLILVDSRSSAPRRFVERAYAVASNPSEAVLAVDGFFEHKQLADRVAARTSPPRRCARCSRNFDAARAGRGGTTQRFVRFGSIALCGACVEDLRRLLRQAQVAVVEASC
jgi:hypothetical protein